jgi:hypothetical protein
MTTYYVNKSGSNSNNGTTPALAKLTIQAGLNLCATTGDSVVVGSGSYSEFITVSNKQINLYADGVVVLDGSSLYGSGSAIAWTNSTLNATNTITISGYITGGKWVIKNYNTNVSTYPLVSFALTNGQASGETGHALTIKNMELYGNANNQIGLKGSQTQVSYAVMTNFIIENCIFSGFANMAVYSYGNSPTGGQMKTFAKYNTFYNNAVAIDTSIQNGTLGWIYNNVFHSNVRDFKNECTVNPTGLMNYNIHYNYTYILTVNNDSTKYSTLATVQAISSEIGGYSANPNLIDPANGIFFLSSTGDYGAYPYSSIARGANYNPDAKWIITATADNSGWYNPDGFVTKNGTTGFFELSGAGPTGVIWSPVYDLGSAQYLTQFNLASIQTWSTNMVDTTKTDIKPNYQTAELRTSLTSFNQNDAVIAWTEIKINCPFPAMAGRYAQIRLTLRNDDVSA